MGAPGKRNYPWARIADELRARPGEWRLFTELTAVPPGIIDRVRRGTVRALRSDDGKFYARAGVQAWRDDQPIVDVWMRSVPTQRRDQ